LTISPSRRDDTTPVRGLRRLFVYY